NLRRPWFQAFFSSDDIGGAPGPDSFTPYIPLPTNVAEARKTRRLLFNQNRLGRRDSMMTTTTTSQCAYFTNEYIQSLK
ncbi:hypothetical protein ACJX0J_029968, partial [Zea mays]